MSASSAPNDSSRLDGRGLMDLLHEILAESRRRRVLLYDRQGKIVIDMSLLLAALLSIAAPALPVVALAAILLGKVSLELQGSPEQE